MMVKSEKPKKSIKHYKTPSAIEEEQSRTLYIRLPKTIENVDEINELFSGSFEVKLPRQSGRYCHVIFSDLKQKIKNLKALRSKRINGRRIFTAPPRPMDLTKKKSSQHKKIVMEDPKDESSPAKYLFISNIAPGVKSSELINAFSGAITVALLKGLINGTRTARIKMPLSKCLHYLKNKSEWPTFKGRKVKVEFSKKTKGANKKTEKNNKPLDIDNSNQDNQNFFKDIKKSKKLSNKVEIEDKSSDENITENDEEDNAESNEECENIDDIEEDSE